MDHQVIHDDRSWRQFPASEGDRNRTRRQSTVLPSHPGRVDRVIAAQARPRSSERRENVGRHIVVKPSLNLSRSSAPQGGERLGVDRSPIIHNCQEPRPIRRTHVSQITASRASRVRRTCSDKTRARSRSRSVTRSGRGSDARAFASLSSDLDHPRDSAASSSEANTPPGRRSMPITVALSSNTGETIPDNAAVRRESHALVGGSATVRDGPGGPLWLRPA